MSNQEDPLFRSLSWVGPAIARAATTGVGLAVVVYVVGWVRLLGYYARFQACWMIPDASASNLVLAGAWPAGVLVFLSWGFASSIAMEGNSPTRGRWERNIMLIMWAAGALAVVLLVGEAIPAVLQHPVIARVVSGLIVAAIGVTGTAAFISILITVRSESLVWSLSLMSRVVTAILMGIVLFPYFVGDTMAQADSDVQRSRLPVITLRNPVDRPKDLRLLMSGSSRVYAVDLRGGMAIYPLGPEEILFVAPAPKNPSILPAVRK